MQASAPRRLAAALTLVLAASGAATARAASETATLTASVEVVSTCTVSDAELDFGTYVAGQQADLEASAVIEVAECPVASVRIELDGGGSGNVRKRQLRDGQGNTLAYQLYADAGMRTVFGEGRNGRTLQLDAQGAGRVHVYGRIPGGQVVPEGSYSDTVRITMSF